MSTNLTTSRGGFSYWPIVKFALLIFVVVFVVQRAIQIWNTAPKESISVNVVWLAPAALAYFMSWLPSVWLWMALLSAMRQPVNWWNATRAYYVSHLGKYVPGKALALVIRGAMVEKSGVSPLLAGVTGGCETMVYMATGTALFIALSPVLLGNASAWSKYVPWSWCRDQPIPFLLIVAAVTFTSTPLSAWFFTRLCRKIIVHGVPSAEGAPSISATLISKGVCATSIGWLLQALSLGFVAQSVSSEPFDPTRFPLWLAASTLSTVGGFVVLIAPGGLGIREGLLIEILKNRPEFGPMTAIMIAAILRATWFVTELAAAGIFLVVTNVTRRGRSESTEFAHEPRGSCHDTQSSHDMQSSDDRRVSD